MHFSINYEDIFGPAVSCSGIPHEHLQPLEKIRG